MRPWLPLEWTSAPFPIRSLATSILAQFTARRYERCRLVVETAVKLGEMEKDTSIPIQTHLDLVTDTFRQLGAPI